jgi:hypothetical protein
MRRCPHNTGWLKETAGGANGRVSRIVIEKRHLDAWPELALDQIKRKTREKMT